MAVSEPQREEGPLLLQNVMNQRQAFVVLSFAAGAIFLLDLLTPPTLDIPILYIAVLLLCLRCRGQYVPLMAASTCIVLTFVPPIFVWSSPLSVWIMVNRSIAAAALGITAVLVANRRATEVALRESQNQLGMRVEEQTSQLRAVNQRLTDLDRIRMKFLSVISHELRTPMAAIRGFVENMLNGVTGPVSEQQAHYLKRVLSNVDRLTRLIGQILDSSRLELGGMQLVLTPCAPGDLVRAIGDNAQAMAAAKQIVVTTRIEKDLPMLTADPDKLEQILLNLVGNAMKFTPAQGRVTIECRSAGDEELLFTVSDTGCGIAPEDIPKVFNQFSGVNPALSSARGAQLGLYITKGLVLLHGGRIEVESTPGKGSHFHVRLPLQLSSDGATPSGV